LLPLPALRHGWLRVGKNNTLNPKDFSLICKYAQNLPMSDLIYLCARNSRIAMLLLPLPALRHGWLRVGKNNTLNPKEFSLICKYPQNLLAAVTLILRIYTTKETVIVCSIKIQSIFDLRGPNEFDIIFTQLCIKDQLYSKGK
jgi:hypothetical protein